MDNNKSKIIEYIFYIQILMFYVGRTFELFTFVIDVVFLIGIYKKQIDFHNLYHRYKLLFQSIFMLLVFVSIQSFFTINPLLAYKNSLGAIRFVIYLVAVMWTFQDKKDFKKIFIIVAVATGLLIIDSLYQYINGTDIFGFQLYKNLRMTGWDHRPQVGSYLPVFIGILIVGIFYFNNYKMKLLFGIFSIVLIVTVVLAGGRGDFIALFGSIFIVIIANKKYRKYAFVLIGIFVVVSIIIFNYNQALKDRYSTILHATDNQHTSGRVTLYWAAIDMFRDNPLLGVGNNIYRYEFHKYMMRYKNNGEMDKYYPSYENIEPHHAHNMLLVVLSEMGLIGFMIFLYIFYIIYVKFIKPYNLTYLGSIGFIFAVSPLQTGKSISGSDWKFFVTLSLLFVFITYFIEKNKINSDVTT